jgi:BMFP domain-containing protein YqiC
MALPEQIRKQTEAVQKLYEQLNDDGNNTGENENSADGTATSQAPAADESSVQNVATPPVDEQKTDETKSEDENSETYAQRWRSLQGSYNAEVRTRHELQSRVQQMEQLLASISAQQTMAPAQPEAPVSKLVTERDVEEYGESIDMMRKVTRDELGAVAQRIAQLESSLHQMHANVMPQVQAVAQRQQMTSEQQFWSDLTRLTPNWRTVNDSQSFQNWLLEADPLTGITRQTYLEDAQRNLDAGRVANFFRSWLEITGQAPNAQSSRASSSELERQVAPGRSKTSGAPTSNTAKTYSPADIQKFFSDVRQGKYKGREAERDRIERDIFAAQRENRIIANA